MSRMQRRKQALIVIVWTSFLYLGYQLTNHFHLFQLNTLPLFEFEKTIPFLIWTVIPYYLLVMGMYLPIFFREAENFYRALLALTIAVLLNYSIFLFFPTTYPRPDLPQAEGVSMWLYQRLVEMDTPANCLPSGHITVSSIGCYYLIKENRQWAAIILAVFGVLTLSVLTTKQHYILDIFAGLATAAIGMLLARWYMVQRRLRLQETP